MQKFMHRIPPMEEEWRRISDYIPEVKDYYIISNYGKIYSEFSNEIMSLTLVGRDYYKIGLVCKDNKRREYLIHRLVLMCFNPISNPELYQVNHIIGCKSINEACVLEWCNNSENGLHAYRMGLRKQGEDHDWAKLSNETVHEICKLLVKRLSFQDICNSIGLEYNEQIKGIISAIKNKKIWKSISCNYPIPETNRNDQIFSDGEAKFVCECLDNNMSNKEIVIAMGYDINSLDNKKKNSFYRTITRIRNKTRYTHISKDYNF